MVDYARRDFRKWQNRPRGTAEISPEAVERLAEKRRALVIKRQNRYARAHPGEFLSRKETPRHIAEG